LRNGGRCGAFDVRRTATLHGSTDAKDFARRAASRNYLGQSQTPTLIIRSSDDPFVFHHSLPEPSELSSCTEFELHTIGGHVGFVEGSLRNPRYYLERRIPLWPCAAQPRDGSPTS
ncbi:hydrolase, partial [Pseudomonas syringae]